MSGAIITLTRRALARKAWPSLNCPILAMLLGSALWSLVHTQELSS